MDGYPRYEISVLEPVNWAMDWTKRVLFRPFDLKKWFVIGFCAFLATLGEGGGGGGGNYGGGWQEGGGNASPQQMIQDVQHYVTENLHWLIPAAVIGFVLIVGVALLLAWLRSRGKFMFLYCVARDTAEVARPWSFYEQQGNSLFKFLVLVGAGTFLAILPFVGALTFFGISLKHTGAEALAIVMIAAASVAVFSIAMAAVLVLKFTKDFVVPIMYLRQNRVTEAWREFGGMLSAYKGKFALYILFQIVIHMAIGLIVVAAALITCCCAACVLGIPYIGTVLLLPVLVFLRSYSAFYLAQFGPEYNVFMTPSAPQDETQVPPSPEEPESY